MYYRSKKLTIQEVSEEQLQGLLDHETLSQIREDKMESKKIFHYNLEFFMILTVITVLTVSFINFGGKQCLNNYSQSSMTNQN
jgi:hypothetical protein